MKVLMKKLRGSSPQNLTMQKNSYWTFTRLIKSLDRNTDISLTILSDFHSSSIQSPNFFKINKIKRNWSPYTPSLFLPLLLLLLHLHFPRRSLCLLLSICYRLQPQFLQFSDGHLGFSSGLHLRLHLLELHLCISSKELARHLFPDVFDLDQNMVHPPLHAGHEPVQLLLHSVESCLNPAVFIVGLWSPRSLLPAHTWLSL